ncbi:MAG: hypothetical protein HC848_07690 [Limnobacter sp.]|nr:hypothetical protein [Limnobacter sp.]
MKITDFPPSAGVPRDPMESTPEWQALAAQRAEIESDVLLDGSIKADLMETWRTQASQTRAVLQKSPPTLHAPLLSTRYLPRVLACAAVAGGLALTWATGGIHAQSFRWPATTSSGKARTVENVDQAVAASAGHPGDGVPLENRIEALRQKLAQNPADVNGWVLLARSYAAMADYTASAQALRKALELVPGHPGILADLADVLAMAQGKSMAGEPETLVQQALVSDPGHIKALALAATAAEQAGRVDQAEQYWQRFRTAQAQQAPPDSFQQGPPTATEPGAQAVWVALDFKASPARLPEAAAVFVS